MDTVGIGSVMGVTPSSRGHMGRGPKLRRGIFRLTWISLENVMRICFIIIPLLGCKYIYVYIYINTHIYNYIDYLRWILSKLWLMLEVWKITLEVQTPISGARKYWQD